MVQNILTINTNIYKHDMIQKKEKQFIAKVKPAIKSKYVHHLLTTIIIQ